MFKNGFTLAEVLITLGILGVIAAITLPTMAAYTKYKQLSTKLAKFASTTENTTRAWVAMNGPFRGSVLEYEDYIDENGETKTRQNVTYSDSSVQDFIDSSFLFKQVLSDENTVASDNICEVSTVEGVAVDKLNYPYGVLNDGTSVSFSYVYSKFNKKYSIDKYGRYAFSIVYDPNVKGLPKGSQTVFIFAVTEQGFMVPNQYDKCLSTIMDNNWNAKSSYYTDKKGACRIS